MGAGLRQKRWYYSHLFAFHWTNRGQAICWDGKRDILVPLWAGTPLNPAPFGVYLISHKVIGVLSHWVLGSLISTAWPGSPSLIWGFSTTDTLKVPILSPDLRLELWLAQWPFKTLLGTSASLPLKWELRACQINPAVHLSSHTRWLGVIREQTIGVSLWYLVHKWPPASAARQHSKHRLEPGFLTVTQPFLP